MENTETNFVVNCLMTCLYIHTADYLHSKFPTLTKYRYTAARIYANTRGASWITGAKSIINYRMFV